MKVSVIGGGPGRPVLRAAREEGLAALGHHGVRAQPSGRHVRLRRGVLRPDARYLQGLRSASPTSGSGGASPTGAMSTWSTRARRMRSGGNGFCGCSRVALLNILQDRGRELGVHMRFQREVEGLEEFAGFRPGRGRRWSQLEDPTRSTRSISSPAVDLRPNKFTWLGSTRPLDAFKYFFKETPQGMLLAHCYQYEADRSHLGDRDGRADLAQLRASTQLSETDMLPVLERVFAEELDGHPLIANRSLWRNFPNITNKTWVYMDGKLRRCSSATQKRRRISPSAREPSWRWRTRSRCSRLSRSSRTVKKALTVYDTARSAKRWRRRSTRPTCRLPGSST